MENLSSTWICLSRIKYKIVTGHSVRSSILEATKNLDTPLEEVLFQWIQKFPEKPRTKIKLSPMQKVLMNVLHEGLVGKPIYESLAQLETDVHESLVSEINEHVQKLPFLALVPMLFFIGPSLFLLLVGPILSLLIKELSV